MWTSELDSAGSGYGGVTSDYEYNNDHSSFIKFGEILIAGSEETYSNETSLTLISSDDAHPHVR
jgi:hypothetical protein